MKKKGNKERRFCKKRKWKIKGNWKRVKGETFGNKKMTEGRWRERELDKKKEEKIKKIYEMEFFRERERESFSQLYYYTVRVKPPKK